MSGLITVCVLQVAACRPADPPYQTAPPQPSPPVDPYADLAPVGRAIGSARVVALGEPAHAEGNMFAVQARLVAYLHERLGFTVLAWEAGLWSCETDAAHCVGRPWGDVVETRAIRELPASYGLRVTGFDFQFTGMVPERSVQLLRDTLAKVFEADASLAQRLNIAFDRFPKIKRFHALTIAERAEDREAFRAALASMRGRTDVTDPRLLERAIQQVIGLYDWHEAVHADVSTKIDWNGHAELNNVRDKAMADNVLWLLNDRYPGQKIVLWLANLHAARDLSQCVPVASVNWSGYRPMGSWLAGALGPSYFALGFTGYDGTAGNPPAQPNWSIGPAHAESIEAVWVPRDVPYRFVTREDLGDASREGRFFGFAHTLAPWGRVLDGGLVFRIVTPATLEATTPLAQ